MGITVSSFVEDSDLRVRMLAFVLLLPLTAAVSVVGRTDLIDGHFKYKAAPGDGIEDYYGRRWGIPTEVVGKFKEEPYVEVWQLHESGSGFDYLAERKEIDRMGRKPLQRIPGLGTPLSRDGAQQERICWQARAWSAPTRSRSSTWRRTRGSPRSRPTSSLLLALRKPLWQQRPTEAWGRGSCSRASMKGSMRTEHLFHSLFCPSPLPRLSLGPHLYIMAERNEKVF